MVMAATMPSQAHGPQNGHDFPVTAGRRLMNAPAAGAAGTQPRHRSGDSAFVQKNQPLRRDRAYPRREFRAPLAVGFAVALAGVERLFLSRKPILRSRCQICGMLSLTAAWLRSLS